MVRCQSATLRLMCNMLGQRRGLPWLAPLSLEFYRQESSP